MNDQKVTYWDREKECYLEEDVFAKEFLSFVYEHPLGKILGKTIFSSRPLNYLYGLYKKSSHSTKKIAEDIEKYRINMDDFQEQTYKSYREFFLREFLPGKRSFVETPSIMPAFAEGKYLGYKSTNQELNFTVKGTKINLETLLGSPGKELLPHFLNGPMLISRLCPIDYHYFHFPDDGEIKNSYRVHGRYHSVNIMALRKRPTIFLENERELTLLDTKNFGKLMYIEVGAMCVGKIIQEHTGTTFSRGERKGFFDFGASTVIVLGEPGKWLPSEDILASTKNNAETKILLGSPVGQSLNKR